MEVPLVTLNYVFPGCFGSELMQKQNRSSELERISISCRGYILEVANWGSLPCHIFGKYCGNVKFLNLLRDLKGVRNSLWSSLLV